MPADTAVTVEHTARARLRHGRRATEAICADLIDRAIEREQALIERDACFLRVGAGHHAVKCKRGKRAVDVERRQLQARWPATK